MTYPNILILDYLKRTRRNTPAAQMKAEQLINLGYQRLLTFETAGGGFDWFGKPPAKTVLTAYGLLQLVDMARVAPVDPALIERATRVLRERQQGDGSWTLDAGAHTLQDLSDPVPLTAYVTWALAHAGASSDAVDRGLAFLAPRVDEQSDPYVMALAAMAFATARPESTVTRRLLDTLDRRKTEAGGAASWATARRTLTYGGGAAAAVETTALAAQAFLVANRHAESATRALTFLVRQRTPTGAWSTTQATILALQALLAASEGIVERGDATLQVQLNGHAAAALRITPQNADVLQQVDLTPYLAGGRNRVSLVLEGAAHPSYQLVTRSYLPWRARPGGVAARAAPAVELRVRYDRTVLAQNGLLTANLTVRSRAGQPLSMLIADLGLAPGFAPEPDSLEAMARRGLIERYEITSRQLILYLRDLAPLAEVRLPVLLRARFPVRAQTPPSQVYEYYHPANRHVVPPTSLTVRL